MDSEQKEMELRKFYAEQRDKNVHQLMAVNGQGTFGALAIVASFLIGGLGLKREDLKLTLNEILIWLIIMGAGIALFLTSAAIFSYFYTMRIRRFEKLIKRPEDFNALADDEFKIWPHKIANYLIFFGIGLLLAGVFGIIVTILNTNR